MRKNLNKGFTLIEAMVVIIIIGLLAAAATPAYNEVMARQKVKAGVYGLVAVLQDARSEALKRSGIMCNNAPCSQIAWDSTGKKVDVTILNNDGTVFAVRSSEVMPRVTVSLAANASTEAGFDYRGFLTTLDTPPVILATPLSFEIVSDDMASKKATLSMDSMGRINVCGNGVGYAACN